VFGIRGPKFTCRSTLWYAESSLNRGTATARSLTCGGFSSGPLHANASSAREQWKTRSRMMNLKETNILWLNEKLYLCASF
jgi:hypothetical protein